MDEIRTVTRSQPLVLMSTDRKVRKEMRLDEVPPIAALYRCEECSVWWAKGQIPYHGREYLVFRIVEPYEELFTWDCYRGWRYHPQEAHLCPTCKQPVNKPAFTLFDTVKCQDL